jgi:hypothetical protein
VGVVFALLGLVLLRLPTGGCRRRVAGRVVALAVGAVALTCPRVRARARSTTCIGGSRTRSRPGLDVLGAVGGWVLLGALVACALSLPVRYRRPTRSSASS